MFSFGSTATALVTIASLLALIRAMASAPALKRLDKTLRESIWHASGALALRFAKSIETSPSLLSSLPRRMATAWGLRTARRSTSRAGKVFSHGHPRHLSRLTTSSAVHSWQSGNERKIVRVQCFDI